MSELMAFRTGVRLPSPPPFPKKNRNGWGISELRFFCGYAGVALRAVAFFILRLLGWERWAGHLCGVGRGVLLSYRGG